MHGQRDNNKSKERKNITHFITESTFSYPIVPSDNIDRHWDYGTNIGFVHKVNDHIGVGAHFFLNYYVNGGGHMQYGVRPRLSYFFNKDWQASLSPGVILYDSPYPDGLAGYSLESSIRWKNHLGLTIRYDNLKDKNTFVDRRVINIGLVTGAKKSTILNLVGVLIALITIFDNST